MALYRIILVLETAQQANLFLCDSSPLSVLAERGAELPWAQILFLGVSSAAQGAFLKHFSPFWVLGVLRLYFIESKTKTSSWADFPFLSEILCALVRTTLLLPILVLANNLSCKCFCPQWDSDPACKQNSFDVNK